MTEEQRKGVCPKCNEDWNNGKVLERLAGTDFKPSGGQTIEEYVKEFYGDVNACFSKLILIQVQGVYDGGLYYQCPNCKVKIHRWPNGERLRDVASEYGALGYEELLEA